MHRTFCCHTRKEETLLKDGKLWALGVYHTLRVNNKIEAKFFAYYFLKLRLHNFAKIKKVVKKSQNSRNQGFTY
jgi:hypothetical protein